MKKFLSFFVFSFVIYSVSSQTLPDGFSLTGVGSGWTEPVGTAFNPSGSRLFVWEKRGRVYVCNWNDATSSYVKQTAPVLNIGDEVGNWRDHGLLGFALDPNFDVNGYIYVMYVVDRYHLLNSGSPGYNPNSNTYFAATIGRITRYQTAISSGNLVAIPGSRTILLGETKSTGIPILHESHGVGTLAFAADGTLLATCGDGASYDGTDSGSFPGTYYTQALADGIIRPAENVGAFRSQMLNSHNGKILRLDPATGNGISSNPFYDAAQPRSAKSRVWAMGFRNPYRFYIKPNSGSTNPLAGDIGEIFVCDVGWSDVEEVSVFKNPGQNGGWPLWEGMTDNTSYSTLDTYNQDEPNPLFGTGGCTQQYFRFRDLIRDAVTNNDHTVYNPCDPSQPIVSGNPNRFSHYPPSLDWNHSAPIARVPVFGPVNYTPELIGTPESGVEGTPFSGFCASAACWYTYSKYPAQYRNTLFFADLSGSWIKNMHIQYTNKVTKVEDFSTGFGAILQISECPKDSCLYIIDLAGDAVQKLNYGGNRNPVVNMSSDLQYAAAPFTVNFTGDQSYDPDGDAITYSWDFGDGSPLSNQANPSHNFSTPDSDPKKFVVTLKVTDSQGAFSIDSLIISANNTPPVVEIISPADNTQYIPGSDTTYTLQANVTDAEQGPNQLAYAWQTILRHNTHQHPEAVDTAKESQAVISRIGCNGDTYYWLVTLTVTDQAGLQTMDSVRLYPRCGGPLPLHLLSFNVKGNGSVNQLSWITSDEVNVSHFEIERSYTGTNFKKIGTVNAHGSQGATSYEYTDGDFLEGYVYYRLKVLDKDGGYSYSMVVRIYSGTKTKNDITVSPNPFRNGIYVATSFNQSGKLEIKIVDAKGAVVRKIDGQATSGLNSFTIDKLQDLPAGVYFLEMYRGNEYKKLKILKQ